MLLASERTQHALNSSFTQLLLNRSLSELCNQIQVFLTVKKELELGTQYYSRILQEHHY